ncbi:hypothetical protein LR48_Vigan10g198700 [Vigna angularis]|uniref:Uncharacterized protein n=1 Tax=Phaseolus angularis TaxID=3914 RepID=A0A0L9VM24_PHAAN|nr:hypothetical protein LR48_Vigan10g198700 [Vigna angularis]
MEVEFERERSDGVLAGVSPDNVEGRVEASQPLQPVPIHGRRSSDVGQRSEDGIVFRPVRPSELRARSRSRFVPPASVPIPECRRSIAGVSPECGLFCGQKRGVFRVVSPTHTFFFVCVPTATPRVHSSVMEELGEQSKGRDRRKKEQNEEKGVGGTDNPKNPSFWSTEQSTLRRCSGGTLVALRWHSGTGTEATGTKRHLQRAPKSLGRNGQNTMPCSLRAVDVGAAAVVKRNRLDGLNISNTAFNVVRRHSGKHSVSLSLEPPFSNSRPLSLGHSLPLNVRAASLSTMFEMNFKFQTQLLTLPAPCHVHMFEDWRPLE